MIRLFILLFFFNSFVIGMYAQQNLEFVENKGQWPSFIQYKGELNLGYFALKPDGGYKVLLYNKEDYKALTELFHPHSHSSKNNPTQPIGGGANGGNKKADIETYSQTLGKGIPNQTKNADDIDLNIRGHIYEVKFFGGNPNPIAIPDKPLDTYNNYFLGNDKSKWAGNCRIYTAVTYKNIYPNIDVRYYTDNGNLKYDFIVHPGGNANNIVLYFDGASSLKKSNEQLVIKTTVDDVKENIPVSYIITNKGRQNVVCGYNVKGNIVSFTTPNNLPSNATLVIDPQYVFSSFSGSRASQWGYTATYDGQGNLYSGGIVFGAGFPTSNGAFQTSFQGGTTTTGEGAGFDIGILKFNATGTTRLYATYIGGAGNEYPHSLVVDNNFNCIVAGRTTSSRLAVGGYPTIGTNFGNGGTMDITITKLNASGTGLIGSKTIGGGAQDGVNINGKQSAPAGAVTVRRNYGDDSRSEVIVDNAGFIYLTSSIQSTDFPTTNGAFQTSNNGGTSAGRPQDACLLKFSADINTLLYSTYLGGSGDDAGFVLAINPQNNHVFVAGGTASRNFPMGTGNTYQTAYQGGDCDGFVAEFANNTPNGMDFVKASYFGTNSHEVLYGIQFDNNGFPYIMGTTMGSWPVQNAAFSQTGGKQFIAKLQQNLSGFVYSTIFGTNVSSPNISPTAFLVDRCENVYVSGWGALFNREAGYPNSGTAGLTTTGGPIQPRTDANDFYFFVLQRNAAAQMYGDFYGQNGGYADHVDGGTSRFDRNGVIYQAICANCGGGATFPTTAGVWAPRNGSLGSGGSGGACNLAAVKIAFNLAGVGAQIQSAIKGTPGRTSGCVPLTVNFRDTIAQGTSYQWSFGDGSPLVTTTTATVSHVYNALGTYTARLVSFDPTSCNGSDTSFINIRVGDNEASLGFTNVKLPPCEALNFAFTNTSVPPLSLPFRDSSFRIFFGDGNSALLRGGQTITHSYAAAGTYVARLVLNDTLFCNSPDSITTTLRISPNLKAQFQTPATGCAPYTANIVNNSLGGQTFTWSFPGGTPSSFVGINPPPISYPNVGTYTITLSVFDPQTCNTTDQTSFTVTVNPNPTSSFTVTPQPPQPNTAVAFTNNSSGAARYIWSFGDGFGLQTIRRDTTVEHLYNTGGTFDACLEAINNEGCIDTTCVPVEAIVNPLLDVPSAFSPNGDGVNDVVRIRGFGISVLKWRIYNRWGNVVFETSNPTQAWDGRVKGVIQPQDVYVYVLEATFTDGKTLTKKGDITLLR